MRPLPSPAPPRGLLVLALAGALVACHAPAEGRAGAPEAGDAHHPGATDATRAPTGLVRFLPAGPVVRVELALTPEAQARGLMFRERLPEDQGMLFVFAGEEVRTFWMRNTLIPLDMIFLDREGRVVGIVHEAAPLTESPREVSAASRYVLEVVGGWARAHDVAVGDRVAFEGIPPRSRDAG